MTAARPELGASDVYILGWTEAQITHAILEQAALNGDMTRAGIVAAANEVSGRLRWSRSGADVGGRAQRLHRPRVVHLRRDARRLQPDPDG